MERQESTILITRKIRSMWIALSLCSLLSVICLFLTLIRVSPYVVEEATYIGTMVSLMGVLFTLVVSYQIYNIIDLNRRFRQVDTALTSMETLHSQLNNRIANIDDLLLLVSGQGCVTRALTAINNDRDDDAIVLLLKGICNFLDVHNMAEAIIDLQASVENLRKVLNKIKTINKSHRKQIDELCAKVMNHSNYSFISRQFEELLVLMK